MIFSQFCRVMDVSVCFMIDLGVVSVRLQVCVANLTSLLKITVVSSVLASRFDSSIEDFADDSVTSIF